jgi:hypothetical protein
MDMADESMAITGPWEMFGAQVSLWLVDQTAWAG